MWGAGNWGAERIRWSNLNAWRLVSVTGGLSVCAVISPVLSALIKETEALSKYIFRWHVNYVDKSCLRGHSLIKDEAESIWTERAVVAMARTLGAAT